MAQEARTDGNYNNTVQIVGDGNQVTLNGARPLALSKYGEGHYRAEVRREFDLLKPYARALDIVGRDDERASLRDWLKSGGKLSIRVLTGQGGSGKTRLALDLCDSLPEKEWQAGFIDGDDLKTVCDDASMVAWVWKDPTLVVVDYAATFGDALHRWLGQLVDHAKADAPVLRVLLLERQADEQTGWWRTVFGGGKAKDRAIQERLDPKRPIDIQPLPASNLRREIFMAALIRSAEELKKEPPAVEDSEDFDNRLADLTWGERPLFLMMAAMLAAKDGVPDVLALSRTDLAFDLAKRELSRIGDAAEGRGLDRSVLEILAGYVTLCQGLERDGLIEAVGIVQKRLHRSGDAGPIADLLRNQLPGQNGVAAILPDIIGEAAMLLTLDRDDIGPELALRAFQQTGSRAAASIIRTAQDFADQSIDDETITAPLAWLDRLIEREDVAFDQLSVVSNELVKLLRHYGNSLALIDHARRVTESVILQLGPPSEENREALAHNKTCLGNMLSNLGSRKEALKATEEGVELYRRLAEDRPHMVLPNLAMSVNNLAHRLSDFGRREDALAAAEEAVSLYRRLASGRPDAFLSNLALSLLNLSYRFDDFDRPDDALRSNIEAISKLKRSFLQHSPSFIHWMMPMCQQHIQRCEALGQAPDEELLGPIVEAIQAMKEKE